VVVVGIPIDPSTSSTAAKANAFDEQVACAVVKIGFKQDAAGALVEKHGAILINDILSDIKRREDQGDPVKNRMGFIRSCLANGFDRTELEQWRRGESGRASGWQPKQFTIEELRKMTPEAPVVGLPPPMVAVGAAA
jgi:hypothetical protein